MAPYHSWWIAVLCLLTVSVLGRQVTDGYAKATHAPPEISTDVGSWQCYEVEPQSVSYMDSSVDTAWSGVCEDEGGSRYETYVGYAKWQGHNKRLASPRLHYPGDERDWSYLTTRRVEGPVGPECRGHFEATETILLHAAGDKHAVLYWYQRGLRTFPDEVGFRLGLILAKLTEMPTDSAVVRIAAPVNEASREQVFREQMDLARGIYCEVAKS